MFPLTDLGTVAGVAVLVALLMQALKSKLPAGWEEIAALALGVIVALAGTTALDVVGKREILQAIVIGLQAGAAAIVAYQVQKPAGVLPPK